MIARMGFARRGLLCAAPALALVLAGCGGASSAAPTSTATAPTTSSPTSVTADPSPSVVVIDISISGGAVTPAPGNVQVPLGSDVRLSVTSDVADDVHLHGYDVEKSVPAGGTVTLEFVADQSGTFEVETHESDLLLAKLVVS